MEIGPRFVLNIIKIFQGSFGGPTLFENPHFQSPNMVGISVSDKHLGIPILENVQQIIYIVGNVTMSVFFYVESCTFCKTSGQSCCKLNISSCIAYIFTTWCQATTNIHVVVNLTSRWKAVNSRWLCDVALGVGKRFAQRAPLLPPPPYSTGGSCDRPARPSCARSRC